MKPCDCYEIVTQFYCTDTASLVWPTGRVGENCYGNMWTTTGFCDMTNLPRSLNRHERSANHIQYQIALKTFGSRRIDLALNEQRRLNTSVQNAKVRENGEILKYLIYVACFLVKQQLAFCSNEESSTSSSHSHYVEFLHTLSEKDERLARHLERSTVFFGFSNRI